MTWRNNTPALQRQVLPPLRPSEPHGDRLSQMRLRPIPHRLLLGPPHSAILHPSQSKLASRRPKGDPRQPWTRATPSSPFRAHHPRSKYLCCSNHRPDSRGMPLLDPMAGPWPAQLHLVRPKWPQKLRSSALHLATRPWLPAPAPPPTEHPCKWHRNLRTRASSAR